MAHVMIDLETLSIKQDAAILSVGAVVFEPYTGELADEFYKRVAFKEALANGNVDMDTIEWWIKQSTEAGTEAVSGTAAHSVVLSDFTTWLSGLDGKPIVWGNGPTFDITILENAYTRLNMPIPWEYYHVRDCRTIEDIARGISGRSEYERKGVAHNALDDAKYQAEYISGMWQALVDDRHCPWEPANEA